MRILTGLVICGSLVGCGSDDGDNRNPIQELVDASFNLAKQSGIPGTEWATECTGTNVLNADVIKASSKEVWTFNAANTDVTRHFMIYADDACQEKSGEIEILGNYELKNKEDGSYPVDLSFDKAYLTASSEGLVKALNVVSFCGIENWTSGNKTEITSTIGQGLCQIPESLTNKSYDVMSVEGSKMYFGTPLLAAPIVEEQRPQTVDKTIVFNKQ